MPDTARLLQKCKPRQPTRLFASGSAEPDVLCYFHASVTIVQVGLEIATASWVWARSD